MANSLNDGLSKPQSLGSPATIFLSGNTTQKSVNGQAIDFGTFTGSGNTSTVSYSRTFSAAPSVFCFPTIGSVAVASYNVVAATTTGSFTCAAGSNLAQFWIAVGTGTY